MKIISFASCIILYIGFVHSLDNALIFNRRQRSLIKLPTEITNDDAKSGEWATACPAENSSNDEGKNKKDIKSSSNDEGKNENVIKSRSNDEEKNNKDVKSSSNDEGENNQDIKSKSNDKRKKKGKSSSNNEKNNEDKSLYQNALFVQNIYTEEKLTNILKETKICQSPIKLSVAVSFERNPVYYEFGYNINFDSTESSKFNYSDKTKYKSIENFLSKVTKKAPAEYWETRPDRLKSQKKPDVIKMTPARAKITESKADNKKGFIWIPLFKVTSVKKQPQRIEYEIHRNNVDPVAKCNDYSLGKELFKDIEVDEFYSTEVQENAFAPVDMPSEADDACKDRFECFEKASLIPIDQYRFGTGILTCSNLTTVPIWKSAVKDILQKVDKFLYTLSRVSGRPLRITAGIYENLQLPKKINEQGKNILLKNKLSNLRVPEIIYKMVRMKSNKTCTSEDPGCWSGVLIVIHNHPNLNTRFRTCTDKSVELGWEEITYGTSSTERIQFVNIYVCPIEKITLEKIGLKFNKPIFMAELSLKKFPYTKDDTAAEGEDMRTQVLNELERKAEGELEVESNLIERPYLADDDFELEVVIKKKNKLIKNNKKENAKKGEKGKEQEGKEKEENEEDDDDEEEEEDLENENEQEKGEKEDSLKIREVKTEEEKMKEMKDSASENRKENNNDANQGGENDWEKREKMEKEVKNLATKNEEGNDPKK